MEKLLKSVVGENYASTLKILNEEEVDVEAFYSLHDSLLTSIGK